MITYASHFKDALCGIKELYEEQLKRLDYVVNVLGKVHWSDFADGEKQLTKTTVFLVERGCGQNPGHLNEVIYGIYSPTNYCSIKTV